MKKIIPNLWFDSQAEEAANFYVSIFANSHVGNIMTYQVDTPSQKPMGSVLSVTFNLNGLDFVAINGGPLFQPTPSISFMVLCETAEEVDEKWAKLSADGQIMMELGEYPFSPRFGWCNDRYGFSWQIMVDKKEDIKQQIIPTLMFGGKKAGQAEEAMNLYTSLIENSVIGDTLRHKAGDTMNKEGTIQFAVFRLKDTALAAMDSGYQHAFDFNEAVSLMINCDDQAEIDRLWEAMSADPAAEACGWLKDKFGVSWQITPWEMEDLMAANDDRAKRVMEAMLAMKKIDLAALRAAAAAQ